MSRAAESYLRDLARNAHKKATAGADSEAAPFRLQAVAHAFVMVGLLSSAAADEVLTEASDEFEAHNHANIQPPLRPGAAEYWRLRDDRPDRLSWIPRAIAAGPLRIRTGSAELRVEWLRLSDAGMRFQAEASTTDAGLAERHVGLVLTDLALADEAGRSYQLYWDRGSGTRERWIGDVLGVPPPPSDVTWLELTAIGSAARHRIEPATPLPIEVGPAQSQWPTAAEAYLAVLCATDPPMKFGRTEARDVTAAVAEALLSVGAIPADSSLLLDVLGRAKRSSHPVLPTTWPTPVRRTTPPDRRIPICAALPFARAAVVIEGLSAWGEDVQLHVYGWPWLRSEQWPAVVPAFSLRAIDDRGGEHEGRLGSWRAYGSGEASGDFTLWPAVPRNVRRLHVVIWTLWEAAWADIELPPAGNWAE
ncbi:MAG TPA: hypothetical protein VME44_03775 [Streptosporangiaceae bacterium]|nr:hypothetical protein [Streptosporangiaceae bacterium]